MRLRKRKKTVSNGIKKVAPLIFSMNGICVVWYPLWPGSDPGSPFPLCSYLRARERPDPITLDLQREFPSDSLNASNSRRGRQLHMAMHANKPRWVKPSLRFLAVYPLAELGGGGGGGGE